MSRFLLSFVFCLLLVGCVDNPAASGLGAFDTMIEFGTYIGRQVKAVEKNSFNQGDSFLVYASRTPKANNSMASSFDGFFFSTTGAEASSVCVTKQLSDALTTDRKVFWPGENDYLDFLSVMQNVPASAYTLSFAPATLTFHQSAEATEQHDLLLAVATAERSSLNPVTMNFRHVLSKLQFSAQIDHTDRNYMVKVSSITVKGINLSGSYCFTGQTEDGMTLGTWTAGSSLGATDCSVHLLQPEIKIGTATELTDTHGELMLIPQTATSLQMEYDLYYNSGSDAAPSYQKRSTENKTIDLTGSMWKAGNLYSYVLSIKPEAELNFSCSVGGWQDSASNELSPIYPPQPQ